MSDSVRPHRQQPTRVPRPRDSPGKNTRVGCHFLLQCMKGKVKLKSLSHVRFLATPWPAAYQAPPSIGFSRREYWSGLPLPSPSLGWQWANHSCHLSFRMLLRHVNSMLRGCWSQGRPPISIDAPHVSVHRNRPQWLQRTVSSAASYTTWRRVEKAGTRRGLWSLRMNPWCCTSMELLRYASYSWSFQPPGKARLLSFPLSPSPLLGLGG